MKSFREEDIQFGDDTDDNNRRAHWERRRFAKNIVASLKLDSLKLKDQSWFGEDFLFEASILASRIVLKNLGPGPLSREGLLLRFEIRDAILVRFDMLNNRKAKKDMSLDIGVKTKPIVNCE